MNRSRCFFVLSAFLFLLLISERVSAQNLNLDQVSFSVEPESVISILIDSSTGSFRCDSVEVRGGGRAGRSHEETGEPFVEALVASRVSDFDCKNADVSQQLRLALTGPGSRDVVFRASDAYVRQTVESEGGDFILRVTGPLHIGGVEKNVDLHLVAERENFITFRVTGEYDLQLADFGIDESTVLSGVIDPDGRVAIGLNLVLSPRIGN